MSITQLKLATVVVIGMLLLLLLSTISVIRTKKLSTSYPCSAPLWRPPLHILLLLITQFPSSNLLKLPPIYFYHPPHHLRTRIALLKYTHQSSVCLCGGGVGREWLSGTWLQSVSRRQGSSSSCSNNFVILFPLKIIMMTTMIKLFRTVAAVQFSQTRINLIQTRYYYCSSA